MITLKKISKSQLPELVEMSYENDPELIEKYHSLNLQMKASYETAVLTTLHRIYEMSTEVKLDCYKVIYQKQPIGYVVTFGNYLYSFAIVKRFRKKDILIQWYQSVKKLLGKNFLAALYENNTRAISHLQKQGMKIVDVDEENKIVTLQS